MFVTLKSERHDKMPPSTAHSIRKFRFNRPQKIAAVMLFLLLAQCLWVVKHQTLSQTDYEFARCGREMWEKPSPLAGYFTSCGNIHDGTLAYRAAGLPLSIERIFAGQESSTSTWEMRHEVSYVMLLMRLPFIFAGLALGACLWWVTRRLYGNTGGYIALALYCFAPPVIHACTYPNNEIMAAFGLFAVVYTAIGVAHAMQGPRRKWRPRIVLLTLAFGFTAAAHVSAFFLGLVLAIAFMAYVAESGRAYLPTLVIIWVLGTLFLLFASYAFRPDAFSYVFRSEAGKMWLSLNQAEAFFSSLTNAAIAVFRKYDAIAGCCFAAGAGDDRRAERAVAVGASVSCDFYWRRACRCARDAVSKAVFMDYGRACAGTSCFVRCRAASAVEVRIRKLQRFGLLLFLPCDLCKVPQYPCWIRNIHHSETPRLDPRRCQRRNVELTRQT